MYLKMKPQFVHIRDLQENGQFQTHGGITIGYVFDDENKQIVAAVARCCPRDKFVKAIGRNLILTRLREVDPTQVIGFNDEHGTYEVFSIGYGSIIEDIILNLKNVLREQYVSEVSAILEGAGISGMSGSYVNNCVVNIALTLIEEHEELISHNASLNTKSFEQELEDDLLP